MTRAHIDPDVTARYERQPSSLLPISSAPKDGTLVGLKREVDGRVIIEGEGLFGTLLERSPIRLDDPKWGAEPKWVYPDRMYAFPAPTHWRGRE